MLAFGAVADPSLTTLGCGGQLPRGYKPAERMEKVMNRIYVDLTRPLFTDWANVLNQWIATKIKMVSFA